MKKSRRKKSGRKLKPKKVSLAPGYDGGYRVGVVEIVNPLAVMPEKPYGPKDGTSWGARGEWGPPKITVAMNTATRINAERRYLDDGQWATLLEFQRLIETAGGTGAPAMDPTREVVDQSRTERTITEAMEAAAKKLAQAREELGAANYRMLWALVTDTGPSWATGKSLNARFLRMLVRRCLDQLSALWGYGKARARLVKRQHVSS